MAYSEKHIHIACSERLEVCKTHLVALVKLADFRIFLGIVFSFPKILAVCNKKVW